MPGEDYIFFRSCLGHIYYFTQKEIQFMRTGLLALLYCSYEWSVRSVCLWSHSPVISATGVTWCPIYIYFSASHCSCQFILAFSLRCCPYLVIYALSSRYPKILFVCACSWGSGKWMFLQINFLNWSLPLESCTRVPPASWCQHYPITQYVLFKSGICFVFILVLASDWCLFCDL